MIQNELLRRRAMMHQTGGGGGGSLPAGALPAQLLYTEGYTDFIDSGIYPTQYMSYDIVAVPTLSYNQYAGGLGFVISGERYNPLSINANGKMELQYNSYAVSSVQEPRRGAFRRRYRVTLTPTGGTEDIYDWENNLLNSWSASWSQSSFTIPSVTMGLLGRKNSATSITSGQWKGGLGEMTFYGDSSFGTPVAHFLPCYYQGTFGFWDTVSETFKTRSSGIYGFGSAWNTQGFFPNVRNYPSNNSSYHDRFVDYRREVCSDKYLIPSGCTQIQFHSRSAASSDANNSLMYFNSNGDYISYYNYNEVDRIVSVPTGAVSVRMSMENAEKDNSFIKDYTNGVYIWKGINV